MKNGIIILVNDDVHAVFNVPKEMMSSMVMDRIREGLKDIPSQADGIKSIRVQTCVIEESNGSEHLINEIRGNFL